MSERKRLITVEQFRQLARPTSVHLDEEDVNAYISECEDQYIIPAIKYKNFKGCVENDQSVWDDYFDSTFNPKIFLDGGEWVSDEGTVKEEAHYINGVRKALAYFVYARMVRSDGNILSRAGAMRHRDDYADHNQDPNRNQYNDVMGMAEHYLAECVAYLRMNVKDLEIEKVKGTRARIKAIGD